MNRRFTLPITALGLALLLSAGANVARAESKQELAAQVFKIFKRNAPDAIPGDGGTDLNVLKQDTMVADRGRKTFVVAGKPEQSYLFDRVIKNKMPPKDEDPRPTDADKAVIKKWIEAGAPGFSSQSEGETRPFIDRKIVLETMLRKLNSVERQNAKFLRFFSLTNLHNNPAITEPELNMHRAALSKALNSLSWKRRIVLPEALDARQTIFAIDVRDIGWEEEDLWRDVMKVYPYGLSYGNGGDETLRSLERDIGRFLPDVKIPIVRADWFASTATRPPLYHKLASIPKSATTLEKTLGVNVNNNFLNDNLARAGFAKSGVSQQNRMVERHESNFGSYWKSYDFKANKAKSVLTQFPLGPDFRGNPHSSLAFDHDGGEIIFTLPNHLQGYMLVNNKDERIDEGPVEIVNDRKKTAGTPAIVNGLSCMACHKDGLVNFKDEIRDGSGLAGDALLKVRKLYPEDKTMQRMVEDDQKRFMTALERAVGPFLKVGADQDKPLEKFEEPVGEASQQYRGKPVDLAAAALELDLTPDKLRAFIEMNPALRELGLATLLQPEGAVQRHDWERPGRTSMMQMIAERLDIGTPVRVIK